ncbi:hypothetical protein ABZ922_34175 [Streptomyces shenzhenensis]|uniref:hypothetical protein n=1 Tax=Streptomyces shenzhenensis TaxID=943815 RepID=UPI0033DDAFCD
MTEETLAGPAPTVRDRPAPELTGLGFDPVLSELMREGPVTRIRLPHGEGWAWLVTRYEDVRAVVDELLRAGPPADLTVHAWTRQILSAAHGKQAGEQAEDEMYGYFADLIGVRLDGAAEDVASLLGGAVGRGEVTLEEAVGLAVLLQLGGEAVTDSGGQLLCLLMTRPDLVERLRAEPEIRPRAVDELLRYVPHRDAVGLCAHPAFGFGPHHCPGGMPARPESELLADVLLDRVPGMRLAVAPDEVPFRRGASIRGPETLPVTW